MQLQPSSTQLGFAEIYAGGNPPWDTGRPQPPFREIADQIVSPVLDAGCGTGNTSLFLAAMGKDVTGIDFVEAAIRLARGKALERGLAVQFVVRDAMVLDDWGGRFASVIDSGLFHIYSGVERRRYAQMLAHVTKPGGRLFLYGFSDEEPAAPGGGVSLEDLYDSFIDDWIIEDVQSMRGELNAAFTAEFPEVYPPEGPMMRFAILRRKQ